MYLYFIKQNWLFHASANSAKLTKKIVNETNRVSGGIILPLMQMNARVVLSVLMSLSIFIYDPKVAIVGLTVFSSAYFIIFKVVEIRLKRNGTNISKMVEQRYRLMNEGFGGIKDVLLLGRDKDFINQFNITTFIINLSRIRFNLNIIISNRSIVIFQ